VDDGNIAVIRVWNVKTSSMELEFTSSKLLDMENAQFLLSDSFIIIGSIDCLSVYDIRSGNPASYLEITQPGYIHEQEEYVSPNSLCCKNDILLTTTDMGLEIIASCFVET
jgi:hypothetical protein